MKGSQLAEYVSRFDEYNAWRERNGLPKVGYVAWRTAGSPGAPDQAPPSNIKELRFDGYRS